MSQMAGAKIFSKVDGSAGYWQMKVDEQSSKLFVFNTPYGRFKFDRLPFWVSCQAFFQKVSQIIEGIEGVAHIQDDIICWEATQAAQ